MNRLDAMRAWADNVLRDEKYVRWAKEESGDGNDGALVYAAESMRDLIRVADVVVAARNWAWEHRELAEALDALLQEDDPTK